MGARPSELQELAKHPLVVLGIVDRENQLELLFEADQPYQIIVEKRKSGGTSCPGELDRLLVNLERSRGVAQLIEDFRAGKSIQFPVMFE